MTFVLVPAPGALGLESPAIGPWFSNTGIALAVPGADLSVTVALPAGTSWYPPAIGTLSYAVATTTRPPLLAKLRRPDGASAFTGGSLVAFFRLLPEVEARLDTTSFVIPAAGIATAGVRTRPRVRALAMEFVNDAPATFALINEIAEPPIASTFIGSPADQAAHMGLSLDDDGTTLANAESPITDLKAPGSPVGAYEKLLTVTQARSVKLWAFDDQNRAIDPGAVASWWGYLGSVAWANLWAPTLPTTSKRTVATTAQLTVHLVNAHEGVLDSALLARVQAAGLTLTGPLGVVAAGGVTGGIAFTNAPSPDDAPIPRAAVLPNGAYAANPIVFGAGPVHNQLGRDYVRVGVVDVEAQLVGQTRVGSDRRATDQNRSSTQVVVRRATTLALPATADAVNGALLGAVTTGTQSTFVTPVLDRDFGGPLAFAPPAGLPPLTPPALTATAVIGGGEEVGGMVENQTVLFTLTVPANVGGWVRIWPLGFDTERAEHYRMDGGAGVVLPGGAVNVLARLPDGVVGGSVRLGADVQVWTGPGIASAVYADVRFERPDPVGATAISFNNATQLVACELAGATAGNLTSGLSLFSLEAAGPTLIDLATVPGTAWVAATAVNTIGAAHQVALTEPPWIVSPTGEIQSNADLPGAVVGRLGRNGLGAPLDAGQPLPTQERYEVAAVTVAGAVATAAIGGASSLRSAHELPPHQAGHPGAPATAEVAAIGVAATGPAAFSVEEFALNRRNVGTSALLTAAAGVPPVPATPPAPTPWLAVLRTIAFGVETEPGWAELITDSTNGYPFGAQVEVIHNWLQTVLNLVPGALGGTVVRALDRRLLAGGWGLREPATSLSAAFDRAEDLVYIETPAIDVLGAGQSGDGVNIGQALVDRLAARPGLHVVLCVPRRPSLGWPAKLGRVRDSVTRAAIDALREAGGDRVAVFHPAAGPGRSLRLATTTVIVDDAYALVGTSHLWRRGMTFDGGLSAAIFDETLTNGRPATVVALRTALVTARLGLTLSTPPTDPAELITMIAGLERAGGLSRITPDAIPPPDPEPSEDDIDVWNPDGSPVAGFDVVAWILSLFRDAEGLDDEVTPAP